MDEKSKAGADENRDPITGEPGSHPVGTRAAGRRRPPFVAIVMYTLQACLPPRRWLTLLLPCLGAVVFGALSHLNGRFDIDRAFANIAAEGILSLAVPIAALVIGDAVLGAEIRAGTFHFTWLSPTPTWQIVLGRWLGGSLVTLATITPACAIAAFVAGSPSSAWPITVAAASAGVSYVAAFIAVGVITRRTAVWSLAIVFLVERLLGAVLTGTIITETIFAWPGMGRLMVTSIVARDYPVVMLAAIPAGTP